MVDLRDRAAEPVEAAAPLSGLAERSADLPDLAERSADLAERLPVRAERLARVSGVAAGEPSRNHGRGWTGGRSASGSGPAGLGGGVIPESPRRTPSGSSGSDFLELP
ncbi:hypothetical protein EV138_0351 [Kribbella voronezhensis]|uniref:Uncharacterized protein n=1 Tax=Kribbella voronezhensis TaxID=2512212 RepID=A0A4R7T5B3_9ACTN|nr:hypothetical protein EV138_0351 [Kribbella voronezhensis]